MNQFHLHVGTQRLPLSPIFNKSLQALITIYRFIGNYNSLLKEWGSSAANNLLPDLIDNTKLALV